MKKEKFPHTRKPLHWRSQGLAGTGNFGATEESTATGGAKSKTERFLHRGSLPTSTHQPERLVCSPAGAGGG